MTIENRVVSLCPEVYLASESLHEDQVDGGDQTGEGKEMVPVERLPLEEDVSHDGKDDERDTLLDDLELDQAEGAAIALEANAVGWHLTTIFEEGNAPRENDDANQRPVGRDARLLQAKMAVPGQRHEDVAAKKQQNGVES